MHKLPCFYLQTTIKKHVMKAALKRGIDTGVLVQLKNSYKVSAEAKKPAMVKKPKAKAAAKPKKKVSRFILFFSMANTLNLTLTYTYILYVCKRRLL